MEPLSQTLPTTHFYETILYCVNSVLDYLFPPTEGELRIAPERVTTADDAWATISDRVREAQRNMDPWHQHL